MQVFIEKFPNFFLLAMELLIFGEYGFGRAKAVRTSNAQESVVKIPHGPTKRENLLSPASRIYFQRLKKPIAYRTDRLVIGECQRKVCCPSKYVSNRELRTSYFLLFAKHPIDHASYGKLRFLRRPPSPLAHRLRRTR